MRVGATLAQVSDAEPRAIAGWARRLVDAGFESLWTPEIIGRRGFVPDPFIALAVAAAVTEGVELGTATVQVPLHHPAELAHRVRSLLLVCGDRLSLGVSPGSTATDYALLDRDFSARFDTFHHNVAQLRALLTEASDAGRAMESGTSAADGARLASAGAETAEAKTAGTETAGTETAGAEAGAWTAWAAPPVLLGSWGANVERAAREFDGWIASGYRRTPEQIFVAHGEYRSAGGRRAIVCAVPTTDLDDTARALHRYAEAGFDDAVVLLERDGPEPHQVRALFP